MRFLTRSLIGLFLMSLSLGLIVWAGSMISGAIQETMNREERQRPARERVFTVNTVELAFQQETPELIVFGEVQSRQSLEIRAAVGGTLVELAPEFAEGGLVTEGQLLARFDATRAQRELARSEADLLDAQAEIGQAASALSLAEDDLDAGQAQLDLRERGLDRQQNLAERGSGTAALVEEAELTLVTVRQAMVTRRKAVEDAKARIELADTNLQRAKLAVEDARRDLEDTEIYAPFSGTLSEVSVAAGGLVSDNEQVATLIDPDHLEVVFRVSTPQYARLLDDNGGLLQQPVQASLDGMGDGLTATGILTRASAAVGEGLSGRVLYASLDQAYGFKPGDFVTLAVQEPILENVARIPASAVNAADEVLILGEDDRLQTAQVDVLRAQADDVLIRADDLQGAEIVAQRTPLLGTGIKVQKLLPAGQQQVAGGGQAGPSGGQAGGGQAGAQGADRAADQASGDMIELSEDRRAKLTSFVETNERMPADAKERFLDSLQQPMVPAALIERLESRMGS